MGSGYIADVLRRGQLSLDEHIAAREVQIPPPSRDEMDPGVQDPGLGSARLCPHRRSSKRCGAGDDAGTCFMTELGEMP